MWLGVAQHDPFEFLVHGAWIAATSVDAIYGKGHRLTLELSEKWLAESG